jgi:hypothetical protein
VGAKTLLLIAHKSLGSWQNPQEVEDIVIALRSSQTNSFYQRHQR